MADSADSRSREVGMVHSDDSDDDNVNGNSPDDDDAEEDVSVVVTSRSGSEGFVLTTCRKAAALAKATTACMVSELILKNHKDNVPPSKQLTTTTTSSESSSLRQSLTYAQTIERARQLAQTIETCTDHPPHVALLLENANDVVVAQFAVAMMRCGTLAVNVNYRLAPQELAHILADSEATVVIAHANLAEKLTSALTVSESSVTHVIWACSDDDVFFERRFIPEHIQQLPVRRYDGYDDGGAKVVVNIINSDGGDIKCPFQMFHTSGTTGKPKGVVHTHEAVSVHAIWAATVCYTLDETTIWAHVAPMFHAMDAFAVFAVPFVGGQQVCVHGAITGARIVETFHNFAVTETALSAAMLSMACAAMGNDGDRSKLLKSLRCVSAGGAPVPDHVWKDFAGINTTTIRTINDYGMTECCGKILVNNKPVPFLEVRIVDARTFEEKIVGEVGELAVRGVSRVRGGYWRRFDKAAEDGFFAISNDDEEDPFLLTGDLAKQSADGTIAVVGRAKDMILVGGENVYSAEVERVILQDRIVAEVAVLGLDDDVLGEVVVACVAVTSSDEIVGAEEEKTTTEQRLRALCESELAPYKVPVTFHVCASGSDTCSAMLPRNAMGKINKTLTKAYLYEQSRQMAFDEHQYPASPLDDIDDDTAATEVALAAVTAAFLQVLPGGVHELPEHLDSLDSVRVVRAASLLVEQLRMRGGPWASASLRLSTSDLYEHNTAKSLAKYIAEIAIGEMKCGKKKTIQVADEEKIEEEEEEEDFSVLSWWWQIFAWFVVVVMWKGWMKSSTPRGGVLPPEGLEWDATSTPPWRRRWRDARRRTCVIELALDHAPQDAEDLLRLLPIGGAMRVRHVSPHTITTMARPAMPTSWLRLPSAELRVAKAERASERCPSEWMPSVEGGAARAVLSISWPGPPEEAMHELFGGAFWQPCCGDSNISVGGVQARVNTGDVLRAGTARASWMLGGGVHWASIPEDSDLSAAVVAAHLADAVDGGGGAIRVLIHGGGEVILPPRAAIAPPRGNDAAAVVRLASKLALARSGVDEEGGAGLTTTASVAATLHVHHLVKNCSLRKIGRGMVARIARVTWNGTRIFALEDCGNDDLALGRAERIELGDDLGIQRRKVPPTKLFVCGDVVYVC